MALYALKAQHAQVEAEQWAGPETDRDDVVPVVVDGWVRYGVEYDDGLVFLEPGYWLVAGADGWLDVFSDEAFRELYRPA